MQNNIKRVRDPLLPRNAHEYLRHPIPVLGIALHERNMTKVAVHHLGYARVHEVVEVEGDRAVGDCFVPAMQVI